MSLIILTEIKQKMNNKRLCSCNLHRTDNQLTVIRTKFPQEKQWNECLPRTNAMRRALESSSVTRLSSSLICDRAFVPHKCLGIPASQPSYHSTLGSLDTVRHAAFSALYVTWLIQLFLTW